MLLWLVVLNKRIVVLNKDDIIIFIPEISNHSK